MFFKLIKQHIYCFQGNEYKLNQMKRNEKQLTCPKLKTVEDIYEQEKDSLLMRAAPQVSPQALHRAPRPFPRMLSSQHRSDGSDHLASRPGNCTDEKRIFCDQVEIPCAIYDFLYWFTMTEMNKSNPIQDLMCQHVNILSRSHRYYPPVPESLK